MKNWLSLPSLSFRERLRLPARLNGLALNVVTRLAARLSPREWWCVVLAGIALLGTILSLFVITPLWDLRGRLQNADHEAGDQRRQQ